MNFLAPLFLLGALAVALPVLFHLIRRTTRVQRVFSSLMFLNPSPPRLTRRSRLEHLLLLALRCGVVCLLALGFARPFFKQAISNDARSATAKRILVLVDTSASMRRANLWAAARENVDSVLRKTAPDDQAAVFTFDRQVTPLVTFDQWNAAPVGERAALAMRRLFDISPGWCSTHLGNALITAAETLADNSGKPWTGPRQIVLVSDLQEGSRLDQLQAYEWPKGIALSVETVKPSRTSNAGLQLVTDSENSDNETSSGAVRVRVNNAADSKRDQFKVGWAQADGRSFAGAPVEVYVPPSQSRTVPVPLPPASDGLDRIVLQGDDEDFDNTVFVIPPETERLNVVYFGNDAATDTKQPLYFLQRAFQETRRQTVQVLARPAGAPFSSAEAQAAALLVVSDSLPDERAQALHDQVAAGKTLVFTLTSETSVPTLARLLGLDHLSIEEAHPGNYALLAEIDFHHPLFAPFDDPRFSDFTKIHFWKYRRVDAAAITNARVVAKFDSGDPAVLDAPLGKGRVIIFAASWQPEDSQLALSTKFVPLLYSALDYGGAASPLPAQYHVGDIVPLAPLVGAANSDLTIRLPDGLEIKSAGGKTNFSQTMTPGIYSVASTQPLKRFAVNLDPAESRTMPLPEDELERLGAPVSRAMPSVAQEAQRNARLQNTELENRQKLWRWLIVAALATLLAETWLAGHTARQVAPQEGTT